MGLFVWLVLALSDAYGADVLGSPGLARTVLQSISGLDQQEVAALALTLGLLCFSVTTAIMLVRARARAAVGEMALRDQIGLLRAESDRYSALIQSEPQVLVSWAAADNEPSIIGDTALIVAAATPQRVLAFGSWLEADKAQAMERAVDSLRIGGEAFTMQLVTLSATRSKPTDESSAAVPYFACATSAGSRANSPS